MNHVEEEEDIWFSYICHSRKLYVVILVFKSGSNFLFLFCSMSYNNLNPLPGSKNSSAKCSEVQKSASSGLNASIWHSF